MTAPILECRNLSREVSSDGDSIRLIDSVDCTFETGKLYTVIGPSGSGKTSLLRLLNRLDEPTSGTIHFKNKDSKDYSPCELRRHLGYLFQTPHMFEGSVRDNLLYADPEASDERFIKVLKKAHLPSDKLGSDTSRLSVGERQRVALARLMLMKPEVLLLDEPTSALDPTATEAIETVIKECGQDQSVTVIMVSHNPEQALRMGGTALLLVSGQLVEQGDAAQVIKDPRTDEGRKYRDRSLT